MKVLIVDDSFSMRMILKGMLRQLLITDIEEARNGEEAIDLVARKTFDLVLLDIHMPIVDGLRCVQTWKNNPATAALPIIIVSSDTDVAQIEKAKSLGVHGYIKKPFRVVDLCVVLEAALPRPNPLTMQLKLA